MNAQEVLNQLINTYHENRFAHVYLLETNNIPYALKDLNYLIKNIICPDTFANECKKCNICHLIDNNTLPNIIFIYPDGKTIKKDQIEFIKSKFANKSLYTKYNIYVIIEPELMNETAFNKMLKFIEEPEDNIIGFFVSSNKELISDTILSRLACVKLLYDDNNKNEYNSLNIDKKTIIDEIFDDFIVKKTNNEELLCYNINVIQKNLTEKVDIIYFFNKILDYFKSTLTDNYTKKVLLCNLVIKYLERLNYNVNIPLLLDSFMIEMGTIYEE